MLILAFLNFKAIIVESVVNPVTPNKDNTVITYPLAPVFGAKRCSISLFLGFPSNFSIAVLLAGFGVF